MTARSNHRWRTGITHDMSTRERGALGSAARQWPMGPSGNCINQGRRGPGEHSDDTCSRAVEESLVTSPQSSSTKPHGPWGRVLLCMVCIDVLAGTVLRGFFALLTTRGFNRGCQASKGSKAKRKQKKQPMMTRTDPPNLSREHWRAQRCVRPRNGSGIQDR